MFSSRLPDRLTPNALAQAVDAARRAGAPLLDLTDTNPTACGLLSREDAVSSLGDPRGLRYEPDPRGLAAARDAVARDYLRHDAIVRAERIVLTAGTSEAYGFLFKLLCNPGDAVLVPQPSYPLFDVLARLEGVVARPYRLEYHGVWWIDRPTVLAALDRDTRALLVVTPNNPTGSMLRAADREWLADLAADRGVAIISDEVFRDYPLGPRADAASLLGEARALTFVLGGLSKSVGLPQVKLAWAITSGPEAAVTEALERLDVIADTYLSVSTAVQWAAASLLDAGAALRAAIAARLTTNLGTMRARVGAQPALTLIEPEGGWSAVLRVPATVSEESLVLDLISRARVVVHPGFFFDFAAEAFLVVSLLPDPAVFAEGIDRVCGYVTGQL
jgi:alanine-synthesizing transaminase